MRRKGLRFRFPGLPIVAAGLALTFVLAGALIWFRPYLEHKEFATSEIPASPALVALTEFALPPHQSVCMSSVAVEPNSQVAEFQLHPVAPDPRGGPPIELILSGASYSSDGLVAGGYPGGVVAVQIKPPAHALIGTACFVNLGTATTRLVGSAEARSVSRSAMTINGTPVVGDVALAFRESRARSLLDRLGAVFGHASELTEHLVPVWLIWLLALVVGIGVPAAVVAAFYLALRDDATAG
jgi:hypothetical protein